MDASQFTSMRRDSQSLFCELRKRGITYKGVLYAGLMLTGAGLILFAALQLLRRECAVTVVTSAAAGEQDFWRGAGASPWWRAPTA